MFYAAMAAPVATGTMAIGRATSTVASPTSWTEYVSNPIITGPSGHSIRLDSVQYVSGTWYLYASDVVANSILLYTSTDGLSFTLFGTVLTTAGTGACGDETVVSEGAVLDDGGAWRMYYSYRTAGLTLPGIRYATSSDGKAWTKAGCTNIISTGPSGSYDSTYIEWHQIQKIGSYYVLSYEGYNGTYWSENIAFSPSPSGGWAKSTSNPVFGPSNTAATWDQNHVATPGYYQIGSTWYLFYQGSNAAQGGSSYSSGHWSLGMATLGSNPTAAIP